ncbi:MAG: NAD(P)H-hydrate dehydratase [Planctomycetes bacterium]|nr:NAD(P)H-hydrate dehydratase [Planctomycetota bacterium]
MTPIPPRHADAHKGTMGRVAIVGGSPGLTGAMTLAQLGALRSGAGLVTCLVPRSVHTILEIKTTEAMTLPLEDDGSGCIGTGAEANIVDFAARTDALLIGPGMGRSAASTEVLLSILERCAQPIVVDADGLWHLSQNAHRVTRAPSSWILTPHEGELRRLVEALGSTWRGRREAAREVSVGLGAVVVAKGPGTLVTDPDGALVQNSSGNPGLASGGTGDVLAGVMVAQAARVAASGGLPEGGALFRAASRAAWLHGRAADFAAYGEAARAVPGRLELEARRSAGGRVQGEGAIGEESLIATDVIAHLPRAILELEEHTP